jgi:arylsulfatase A-like enzyme
MAARRHATLLISVVAGVVMLAGAPHTAPRPQVILLLTLDTTRADHLSVYGYERPTSPNIARIAYGGVLVEHAITTMPMTDPAHASILTGLHPRTHGIRMNGHRLADPSIPTLASWAHRLGYRTAAFVSRVHLRPSALHMHGFDHEDGPASGQRVGGRTIARATAWIRKHRDRPLFVWVHLFDPHAPYEAPEPFTTRFLAPGDPRHPENRGNEARRDPYTRRQVRALTALYDGEIAYADELVGRAFALVREISPAGNPPLVVIAADHGEELGEHDATFRYAFDHGNLLYQGSIDVPLIFWREGALPAGRRLPGPASLVDVAPTLFELVGAPGFATQGTSLRPRIEGRESAPAPLVFTERRLLPFSKELRFRSLDQFSVQDGRYKLILSTPFSRTQLFDLTRDPQETHDLSDSLPRVERELRETIEAWRAALAEHGSASPTIPADRAEKLRKLGYLD